MLRKFSVNIFIRVTMILLIALGAGLSLQFGYYISAVFLLVVLGGSVYDMIRYVNQTNRDLANFFAAVKYDDFVTNSSNLQKGKSFDELHQELNQVNKKFRDIRAEKEANHQFLQTLVKHVDVGLLCVDAQGEVILMNEALRGLLRKSYLINLSGLKKIDNQLWETVRDLEPGKRELLKINIQNNLLQLSIQAVTITLQKEPLRLISFQNIQNELEAQEVMAWQKLIRILTHEIMNSVAPISSLSSTINNILKVDGELEEHTLDQVRRSIAVIHKRSEGLLDFTDTYRTLTRIPPPKFTIVDGHKLIDELETLMKNDLEKYHIRLEKVYKSSSLSFKGDPHLLEQVLINLLKNAIDAVKDQPEPNIKITASNAADGGVQIQVIDNGVGIPTEKMDQIFVPFYTTKEHGSGIGLSLSRQIMRMHKGSIDLQSVEGEGTVVSVKI